MEGISQQQRQQGTPAFLGHDVGSPDTESNTNMLRSLLLSKQEVALLCLVDEWIKEIWTGIHQKIHKPQSGSEVSVLGRWLANKAPRLMELASDKASASRMEYRLSIVYSAISLLNGYLRAKPTTKHIVPISACSKNVCSTDIDSSIL
ncbi:unnamed protein product [Nezara viridula]|uniref:Uncharacterized protein n=1 Tax=Nezara viridula TaxID=85310 RepID=A0A9P0HE69_NEZVI|nr:unnamed protein product [Nezara viridula]